MRITESTFRRIIREEAQRVLQEYGENQGAAKPVTDVLWNILYPSFKQAYARIAGLLNGLSTNPELVAKMKPILGSASPAGAKEAISGLYRASTLPAQQVEFSKGSGKLDVDPDVSDPDAAYKNYETNVTARGTDFMNQLDTYVMSIPALEPAAPDTIPVPRRVGIPYITKQGDTISGILATHYNVRPSPKNMSLYREFARMNDITNPDAIQPGSVLQLLDRLTLRGFNLTRRGPRS